jgi:asparagine synthase (glutamine-hydrolysing)
MLKAAPHRGSLTQVAVRGQVALGISNPEEYPDATLAKCDGMAVAFVGTLDNLTETARLVRQHSATPSPPTPASILLDAFRELGDDVPRVLRGAFAAVVTDGSTLWCFRDQVGWGQTFYRDEPRCFYAATEAKQVVAGSGISKEPDVEVVERIFYGDYEPEMSGGLRGVRRVARATVLSVGRDGLRRRRYWEPEGLLETARLTPDEVKSRFNELMSQAVARTLSGSDVVSLSGGIDSPAVASYAAPIHLQMSGHPIGALSAFFPAYPDVDESRYIKVVCEHLEIPLHSYEPSAGVLDGLEKWISLCDGPLPELPPGEVEEHYCRARELGYRTMLTGEQAEVVFDMRRYLIPHLLSTRRFPALSRQIRGQLSKRVPVSAIVRQLALAFMPRRLIALNRRLGASRNQQVPPWLDARLVGDPPARFAVDGRDLWREEQLAFVRATGIGLDASEMLQAVCGVRERRPWTDVDLYEFFLSLPAEVKYPDVRAKTLVRNLLRGTVHDTILDRWQKTSFSDRYLDQIDYESLRRWLSQPAYRITGVDYKVLEERLAHGSFSPAEYKWAIDLAKSQLFLAQW